MTERTLGGIALRTNWAPCQPGLPPQSKYRGAAKRAAACASAWILVASAAEQMPPPPPPPPPLLPTVSRSAAAAVLGTGVLTGSGGLGCQASVVVRPTVAWCQRPTLRGRGKSAWPRQRCHCCCCRCCYLDHQCYCCCHHCCYCSCWSQ